MIRLGPLDVANRRINPTDGVTLHKTHLISAAGDDEFPSPTAFLIEQDPGAVIRTHFHVNSQFQVFARGSGLLGRREVKPYMVQYVAPHTGYGPIVAGDDGLWYFTLRPSAAAGARYLPERRDTLDMTQPKRQVTSPPHPSQRSPREPRTQAVIEPQADGLAAWMVHVPPNVTLDPPAHRGGVGRFHLVAEGTLTVQDHSLPSWSVFWTSGEHEMLPLRAGRDGACVIIMQFPGSAI